MTDITFFEMHKRSSKSMARVGAHVVLNGLDTCVNGYQPFNVTVGLDIFNDARYVLVIGFERSDYTVI